MRKSLSALILAVSIVPAVHSPVEARRPTPIPTLVTEWDQPAALALLSNQEQVASMGGEELVQQLTRSIFISANEETVAGGVTLYFLRLEGGKVVALRTTHLIEDDLLQAQSRLADDQWPADEIALPGATFLLGEMIVPVSIYLGEDRPDAEMASLEPQVKREEQLFNAAQRLAEGRRGFVVAAYPAADPDSLAGGGFFLPQD